MTTTDTAPTTTCPAWCRADHDLELQESAERAKASYDYLGAPENQPRLRDIFGPDFAPPTGDVLDDEPLDEPLHQQEVGHIDVQGRGGRMVPVRVFIEQGGGQGWPAQISVLCFEETAGSDDVYSPHQARALAALLAAAAQALEA